MTRRSGKWSSITVRYICFNSAILDLHHQEIRTRINAENADPGRWPKAIRFRRFGRPRPLSPLKTSKRKEFLALGRCWIFFVATGQLGF
jgi:hypothetical protein